MAEQASNSGCSAMLITKSTSRRRFVEFIEQSPQILPLLPAVHTTNVARFSRIIDTGRLEVRKCKVYQKDLWYLFYGKPTYQIRRGNSIATRMLGDAAVCFVFRLNNICDPYRIFALDTGAFFGNRYDNFLPSGVRMDDFELPATFDYLGRYVGAFFGSNNKYYDG